MISLSQANAGRVLFYLYHFAPCYWFTNKTIFCLLDGTFGLMLNLFQYLCSIYEVWGELVSGDDAHNWCSVYLFLSSYEFNWFFWSHLALLIHIVVGWNLMVIQPTTWMRFFMDSVEYFLLLRFEIVLESTDRWNTKELSFILAHFAGAFFYFFQSEIYQRKRRFGLNKLFT